MFPELLDKSNEEEIMTLNTHQKKKNRLNCVANLQSLCLQGTEIWKSWHADRKMGQWIQGSLLEERCIKMQARNFCLPSGAHSALYTNTKIKFCFYGVTNTEYFIKINSIKKKPMQSFIALSACFKVKFYFSENYLPSLSVY